MKQLRKTRLCAALGAAIATMSVSTANAVSVDVDHGGFLRYEDSGDALLFPVYTAIIKMINGEPSYTNTAFSVTNTSPTDSMAVKIRFREQKNSMDVWDTIVFLSPNDKFDFYVNALPPKGYAADGHPWVRIDPEEDSCSMVSFPSKFRKSEFVTTDDWNGLIDSVGHVEVIGMANLTYAQYFRSPNLNNVYSLHEATKVKNGPLWFGLSGCQILQEAFANQDGISKIAGAMDATDTLIGRFVINGGNGSGVEAGDVPIVLRNTLGDDWGGLNSRAFLSAQSAELCVSNQHDGYILPDPTVGHQLYPNCQSVYAWDKKEQDHPHLGDVAWLDIYNLDNALEARNLEGDWSNNAANFVGTDWIVSFVDKYVYRDWMDCADATMVKEWCDVTPPGWAQGPGEPWIWGDVSWWSGEIGGTAAKAAKPAKCLPVTMRAFGFNEEEANPEVSPTSGNQLCNEVNIFTMGSYDYQTQSGPVVRQSLIQYDAYRPVWGFENLDSTRGWASLRMMWPLAEPNIMDWDNHYGAATAGLVFMVRATMDPSENNASLAPLAAQSNKAGDDEAELLDLFGIMKYLP